MILKTTLLCLSIFSGSFLFSTFGQNITVAGTVKSKTSLEPLIGATVNIKGSKSSYITNEKGAFTLSAPEGSTLVVTYVGFSSQQQKVTKNSVMIFVLEEAATNTLNEVVVIGYGTQKASKVSGAISTIKSAEIEKLKPVRIEEALQGRASGVTVIQSGSPGSTPTITIRGIPSYTGNGPLIVIDGSQQTQADLNSINPADIESINILKDAATAAIYGVSGGNGVLVVTTKSGRKNQKTEITLNSSYGVQQVLNTIQVLNAAEYGAIINEGSVASGGNIIFNDLSKLGVGTDWQKEIFKNAPIQTHSISAKGGGENMSYFLAAGYLSQGGIVGGYDKSRFNRLNFTSNLTFDLTSKLRFR